MFTAEEMAEYKEWHKDLVSVLLAADPQSPSFIEMQEMCHILDDIVHSRCVNALDVAVVDSYIVRMTTNGNAVHDGETVGIREERP